MAERCRCAATLTTLTHLLQIMLARAPHIAYTTFLCLFSVVAWVPIAALRAKMGPMALVNWHASHASHVQFARTHHPLIIEIGLLFMCPPAAFCSH